MIHGGAALAQIYSPGRCRIPFWFCLYPFYYAYQPGNEFLNLILAFAKSLGGVLINGGSPRCGTSLASHGIRLGARRFESTCNEHMMGCWGKVGVE